MTLDCLSVREPVGYSAGISVFFLHPPTRLDNDNNDWVTRQLLDTTPTGDVKKWRARDDEGRDDGDEDKNAH